jgi:hypothetical protein
VSRAAAAVLVALLAAPAPGRAAEHEEADADTVLFPVLKGGRWGYVDRAGAVVIPPRFDRAGRFSEGLAPVQLGAKHGYVDAGGGWALEPAYEPAGTIHRPFVSGRAAVKAGRSYGYIDRTGALVIPARFTRADDFSEGHALACGEQVACGYVDTHGRGVLGPGFMGGTPLRGGVGCLTSMMAMSRVRVEVHRVGRGRIGAPSYDGCGTFSEGLIAVRVGDLWGFVDDDGRFVIPPRFAFAGDFGAGLAPVRDAESGRCGYVDHGGRLAIPARFRSCSSFADGRARVDRAVEENDRERWAFVDASGKIVIDGEALRPPLDDPQDFDRGLAPVGLGGAPWLAGNGTLLGYVDASGRWVWIPTE